MSSQSQHVSNAETNETADTEAAANLDHNNNNNNNSSAARSLKRKRLNPVAVNKDLPYALSFEQYLENDGYLQYLPRTAWIQPGHFTTDEDGSTLLIVAVRLGRIEAAKVIIEAIYEYTMKNRQQQRGRLEEDGLHYAGLPNAVGNRSEVASISSLSSSSRHNHNIHIHNNAHNLDSAVSFLNGNVNHVNKQGALALTVAAQRGYTSLVYLLITKGEADINAHSNANGTTALIQSSHFGNYDVVRMLLDHGALSEKANKKETTALMRASQEGHVNIVEALLSHNANVNRRNHERMTSLMLASQRGHQDVVQVLIGAGASQVLNERTSQNSTALMLACKRGHQRVVNCLLSAGAELYLRDSRGRTARDIAIRKGFKTIAKELSPCLQNHLIR